MTTQTATRSRRSLAAGDPEAGRPPAHDHPRLLATVLAATAAAIAATSLLGPLALDLMRYRTSDTTLNQLLGSDTAALLAVAPLALAAAVLALRRHPAAPLLATGIGGYALYTYAQVIVGQEYLRLPGNVERFFPLLLGVFLLAEALLVLGWRALPAQLPAPSPRLERAAAVALLAVAVFLLFGLHLRSMLTAWQDPAQLTEYVSSPTPFWLVKLMDLGVVVPAAVATGLGLLRHAGWARRATYVLLTGYSCLALSVAAMAAVMLVNGDPDASAGLAAGFGLFALVFVTLTAALYRPLFHRNGTPARLDTEGRPKRIAHPR
ncbi:MULTISPECIES: hypothetical protein [Micromonospora]|uniref:Uncharacterized protein n=1 Tax=Micromonospora solifontis TaxID=2487138 RepID=A0ABX9WIZ2_9ACTN|nr:MULTISPECIES: hypothetical protein [Micromonospora]NES16437.1 hypothetical protein [Micromonospora sp. PPF5-17B]NES37210.1 hypothetical protein [Micromonospora solifontis]NES57153.1 hypothetical protein [Micromonospora sp. PPF5-6]RNL98561.1 hypothetical protein EFE23_13755 [Micromonospora solifontis]